MESMEQLWHPISGTMEYSGALSSISILSFVSLVVVVGSILRFTHFMGRDGNVFFGPSSYEKPSGCGHCKRRVRVQWSYLELHDMATLCFVLELDAVGGIDG